MARIRTVKPDHWSDRRLPEISLGAHLLWIASWNFSDDVGIFEADPSLLKADIFPRRRNIKESDIESFLKELVSADFIIPFTYQKVDYYITRTFLNHQKIDKPRESKIPSGVISRLFADRSSNSTEESRNGSDKSPCIVEERKGSVNVLDSKESKDSPGLQPGPASLLDDYKKIDSKDKLKILAFIKTNKPDFPEPFVDIWNMVAAKFKLPAVAKISVGRRRKFSTRVKERDFDFVAILNKAITSEFILKGTWFSFDWILENDKNYLKVLEGNYSGDGPARPGKPEKTSPSSKTFDDTLRYLVSRFQEPDFAPEFITEDIYHTMISRSYIPVNFTDTMPGGTELEKQRAAVVHWIKQQIKPNAQNLTHASN